MPIANYTTEVPAEKSVNEIQSMLGKAGAKAVMIDFESGEPSAITFRIDKNIGGSPMQLGFKLPCDWKRTLVVMHKDRAIPPRYKSPQQAKRVAWRVVRDWLRAQLSLIEIGAAVIEQVLLPYSITATGETLYERMEATNFGQLQLTEGKCLA